MNVNVSCPLDPLALQEYIGQVFGSSYVVSGVSRMHGGAQKVVYKVDCTNGFSSVLYVWDLSMNFFSRKSNKIRSMQDPTAAACLHPATGF